jgi:hypothetical protein
MPLKSNVPTWLEPWHEFNLDLLSAEMRQQVIAERQRWRQEVEAEQRTRDALLNRLVTSVDTIASTTVPDQPFFSLDTAVDITARAIIAALHDISADDAHTSEYWTDTCAKHRERLCALAELGRVPVIDMRTGSPDSYPHGLPDWAQCANLGLDRSGLGEFARCQGVEIGDAHKPEKISKKKQDGMLRVIAALLYLRNQKPSGLAISQEIEKWTQTVEGGAITARTVTSYIKEIGEVLGISRKELGLPERGASD